MKLRSLVAIAFAGLLITSAAHAQPLSERVPSDAIIYVGWRGEDDLGDAYKQSHAKAMLDLVNAKAMFDKNVAKMRDQIAMREGDVEAANFDRGVQLSKLTWKHEAAFFFREFDLTDPNNPKVSGAFIWEAGDDKAELLGLLREMVAQVPQQNGPAMAAFEDGSMVGIVLGDPKDLAGALDPAKPRLTANATFKAAVAKTQPDGAMVAFVNVEAILKVIDTLVAKNGREDEVAQYNKVKDALGVSGLKSIAMSAGFDGKEWGTSTFVHAPAPRKGMLTMFDGQAVGKDTLAMAPKSATWVTATHGDMGKLINNIRSTVNVVDPNTGAQIDGMLQMINQTVGFDVDKQMLQAMGPDWLVFTDPTISGVSGMGFVAQNKLRDEANAKTSLDKLMTMAGQMLDAQQQQGGIQGPMGPIQVSISKMQLDQQDVYVLMAWMFQPAVSIQNGRLYVASNPQNVTQAASYAKGKQGTILDSPAYQKAMERLGAKNPIGVKFVDLPQTAPQTYQMLMMYAQMGAAQADPGLGIGEMLAQMPAINQIMPHLSPAAKASWTDDSGFYMRSIEPFPGSGVLGPAMSNMSLAQLAIGGGMLMPALEAAQDAAMQQQGGF